MRKISNALWVLIAIVSFSFFGCEKSQELSLNESTLLLDSLRLEFRILDEQGLPSTNFRQGDNFIFSFLIINESSQHVSFLQSIDDIEDFFRVDAISNDTLVDMGKPWEIIFCEYILGIPIKSNDTLALEIPWTIKDQSFNSSHFCLTESKHPLKAGKYKTGFSSTFSFLNGEEEFTSERNKFEVEFKIQN